MADTIIDQLAQFTTSSQYEHLPDAVIEESKRLVLDSLGCALAGLDHPKGKIGVDYARMLGAAGNEATIIGTGERSSVFGAAFANGELINAIDMDAILPPGHVTPFVLPGALAVGESQALPGRTLIEAIAVSHEMSYRFSKAMDNIRDTQDGKVTPPEVWGYASSIFGATAAIGKMRGISTDLLAHGLGIAAQMSPVNSQNCWYQHAPSSTIKYLSSGMLALTALTAAHMGEMGHRGDRRILDSREHGYARFIGTRKWEPQHLTDKLGEAWTFPAAQSYKPYPHCRVLHALLDCEIAIVEQNDLKPSEIDSIKIWVEGMIEQPIWLNRQIEHVFDGQFSIAHGISMGAHRVKPGKAWQDPAVVFDPSVLSLMERVTHEVHPDYVKLLTGNAASRPARIEIVARGETFVGESRYPKGSPSPDPSSYMTNAEMADKFRHNAEEVLSDESAERIIQAVFNLETVSDVGAIMRLSGTVEQGKRAA